MVDRDVTRQDDGFTLIEVMVALGVFMVIVTALLPMFVGSIRSVTTADHEGVVKGLLQQEVERLRGLPYRVSLGASGDGTDADVDLLDLYYPDVSDAVPATVTCPGAAGFSMSSTPSWQGYVAASAPPVARCPFEPSTGAFFRTVSALTNAQLGSITIMRDLQFLSGGTPTSPAPSPKEPRATYDSAHAVTNYPPSTQVGVTISVFFTEGGQTKVRSLFTQIEKHDAGPTLVTTRVDAQAVEITSLSPEGAAESLTAGVVSLAGSVGDISSADVSLSGVVARMATGDPTTSQFGYGATTTVSAPPSVASLTPVDLTPNWGAGCTALLCYGTTRVASDLGVGVVTDDGLPKAGSSASPLRAAITDTGTDALRFDNVGTATPVLSWVDGVVRLIGAAPGASTVPVPTACPQGPGASARLSGSGYMSTVLHDGSETLRDTAACGSTRSAAVGILPTPWAPDGILKVTIDRSFAWCTVTGGVANGGVGLSASVQVADGNGNYQTPVPAESFDPSTVPNPNGTGMLSKFIPGWSYDTGHATPSGGQVSAEVPGIQVTTVPTRFESDGSTEDPDSAVTVTLGAASCSSESTS